MKYPLLALFLIAFLFTGCSYNSPKNEMTQLQIREIQTRTFASRESKTVLKEIMNVLQDDQFIVRNANAELGLVTGEKEMDVSSGWSIFLSSLAKGEHATWEKNAVIEISANVTQYGDDTKVRVNFQKKVYDNRGGVVSTRHIYDQEFYQDFFTKVDKGLFLLGEAM